MSVRRGDNKRVYSGGSRRPEVPWNTAAVQRVELATELDSSKFSLRNGGPKVWRVIIAEATKGSLGV